MSTEKPYRVLTDEEKSIFLFGYFKGQQVGIWSEKHKRNLNSKTADKEWIELAKFAETMHDLVCEKMNMKDTVDADLGNSVEELESEVLEILDVYNHQCEKQIATTVKEPNK